MSETLNYYEPGFTVVSTATRKSKGNHFIINLRREQAQDEKGNFIPFGDDSDITIYECRFPEEYAARWPEGSRVRISNPKFIPAQYVDEAGNRVTLQPEPFVSAEGDEFISIPVVLVGQESVERIISDAAIAREQLFAVLAGDTAPKADAPPDIA